MMCVKIIIALIMATHPRPVKNIYKIKKISKNICYYSNKRLLNPYLVLSIIRHESGFKVNARSRTEDYGLMQINVRVHNIKCNPFRIKCNIREGTKLLHRMKKSCVSKHAHVRPTHWLRHYNWHSRNHHLRILWLAQAYERNDVNLNRMIRNRRYTKLKLTYSCMTDLCGVTIGE